jgi:cell division protein FtsX
MSKLNQAERDNIPDSNYAFPKEEKEPLNDATHVRNAIARFNQVKGVSQAERDEAWKRIERAAKKFGVEIDEK